MLKEVFLKNGLDYQLLDRTEKTALLATFVNGKPCGFEVVRIYSKQNPFQETITSNSRFGFDGSKCFFSNEPNRARKYFKELTEKIAAMEKGKYY